MERIYKIRNSKGLFSTGSKVPRFNKSGKIWKTFNHVTAHLKQFKTLPEIYKDGCYIIEYRIDIVADYQIIDDYEPDYSSE